MEKRKAHYNLDEVKNLIKTGQFRITEKASINAEQCFSFSGRDIIKVILEIERENLYKSMTADFDNHLWQDVYHKPINKTQTGYIKLQISNEKTVIIQFKEK